MKQRIQAMESKWFFIIASVLVMFLYWQVIQPFALVLVTAGIAAIIFSPAERWLRRQIKYAKLSALLSIIAVFLLIVAPLFSIGLIIAQQASGIVDASIGNQGWVYSLQPGQLPFFELLPTVVQEELLAIDFVEIGKLIGNWAVDHVGGIFSSAATLIFHTVIFFIALYYFLADRERIYQLALELSPFNNQLDSHIVGRITQTIRGVALGALIVACVQGGLATIGMLIFGVPNAFLWGALVIIASQVPMLGVGLVMIPAVLYLFFTGPIGIAVGLLIWTVVVVGLVDNLLSPFLIEGKTNMHPLLILISILGGLQFVGPVGFIIGPTILAALIVLVDLYRGGMLSGKVERIS